MATSRDARGSGEAQDAPGVPRPMLTVAAVARRLGVAPSTLRTWDRRYGLGPSAHTAGSHRRYSPTDVERLVVMRRLTMDGVPPGEAAAFAVACGAGSLEPAVAAVPVPAEDARRRRLAPPQQRSLWPRTMPGIPVARQGGDDLDESDGPSRPEESAQPVGSDGAQRPRGSGGRIFALPQAGPQARGLARAAMSLDSHEVSRLLLEAIGALGVVRTWESLVVPVLQAIGERWRVCGEGVDVEHAFSETALGVLAGVAARVRAPRNASPVLLGCAEGEQHSLPLHSLAAALAELDVASRMLGVGMPGDALVNAVRRCGPSVVFLFARLPVGDASVLEQLRRQRPAPRVLLGGRGWPVDALPPSVIHVSSLSDALAEVLSAVHV